MQTELNDKLTDIMFMCFTFLRVRRRRTVNIPVELLPADDWSKILKNLYFFFLFFFRRNIVWASGAAERYSPRGHDDACEISVARVSHRTRIRVSRSRLRARSLFIRPFADGALAIVLRVLTFIIVRGVESKKNCTRRATAMYPPRGWNGNNNALEARASSPSHPNFRISVRS